jgi:hypothetical protein
MGKKQKKYPGIKEVMKDIISNYENINTEDVQIDNVGEDELEERDYKLWTMKIIKSIEDGDSCDKEAYENLTKKYPQVKNIVDEMIEQYTLFSLYDFEGADDNTNLSAYFKNIDKSIE